MTRVHRQGITTRWCHPYNLVPCVLSGDIFLPFCRFCCLDNILFQIKFNLLLEHLMFRMHPGVQTSYKLWYLQMYCKGVNTKFDFEKVNWLPNYRFVFLFLILFACIAPFFQHILNLQYASYVVQIPQIPF